MRPPKLPGHQQLSCLDPVLKHYELPYTGGFIVGSHPSAEVQSAYSTNTDDKEPQQKEIIVTICFKALKLMILWL